MSQHDLEFADQNFPQMRADMNAALIAQSTRQAGAGAPALVTAARPNRLYLNNVSGLVLVRDNGDTADYVWDTWGQDKVRNVSAAADTILALDMNGVVTYSFATAVAVTLPEAVGNFAAAWHTMLWNYGPGLVMVTPVTSQINGGAILQLLAGQSAQVYAKGGHYWAFKSLAEPPAAVLTGSLVPSFAAAMAGYVMLDGRSIGDAASGADNRAHADTWDLYNMLWTNVAQAWAPVPGGRGASAAIDFAAHKMLGLPDASGAAIHGRDNMSGTVRGRVTAGVSGVDATVLGLFGGSQYAQSHTHGVNDLGHVHTLNNNAVQGFFGSGPLSAAGGGSGVQLSASAANPAVTGISIQAALNGGNQNMGPGIFVNIFCKL
jgi:hypothetical protein